MDQAVDDRLHRPRIAIVDAAGRDQQFGAGLVFELSPQGLGPPSQVDIGGIGIGQPENPGASMRATALVASLELLQQDDVPAPPGQPPRRGRPHGPGADNYDLAVRHGVIVLSGSVGEVGSTSTPLGDVEVVATTLYASDLDRAVAWYEEKLGWCPTMLGSDGDRYAAYMVAGTLIVLEPLEAALEPAAPGHESSTVNLVVQREPREIREELVQRGVVCSDLVESPTYVSFLIRDGDGNRYYVARPVSQEARDAVRDVGKGPSPLTSQ
jgi:hypothetical protein